MPYHTLRLERDRHFCVLTLNRPEKRNAISPEMIVELLAALDEVESNTARVAILTGAGSAFCAGMDLGALKALAEESRAPNASEAALNSARAMERLLRRLYDFPKPLIAAVNGTAVAGGCGIATLCDFTLAAPEAKFGYTEAKIGFIPALVSVFLVRQTGEKAARRLLLTGCIIDAAEAHRLGMVTEVVPAARLLDRARALAVELTEVSPASSAQTKRLLSAIGREELDRQLELAVQASARIRSTPDFLEGLTAFLERRRPKWSET
jgi:methylglutaconyl-CoA hydratase